MIIIRKILYFSKQYYVIKNYYIILINDNLNKLWIIKVLKCSKIISIKSSDGVSYIIGSST